MAPSNSFNGLTSPVFTIQNNGSKLKVAGKTAPQADVSTTLLIPSSNVRTLGSQGTARLFSLYNTQTLTYTPTATSMVSGGEGEFAASPNATDSALLALYGDSVSRRTSVVDYPGGGPGAARRAITNLTGRGGCRRHLREGVTRAATFVFGKDGFAMRAHACWFLLFLLRDCDRPIATRG